MHYTKVILTLFPLSALAVQLSLPSGDIPSACRDICQVVMDVANSCADSQLDDRVENQCVCGGQSHQITSDCYVCMHSNNGHTSNIDQIINVCHINGVAPSGGTGSSTTHTQTQATEAPVASTTAVVAPPADSGSTSTGGHTSTSTSIPAVVTGATAVGAAANGGLTGAIAMAVAGVVGMAL